MKMLLATLVSLVAVNVMAADYNPYGYQYSQKLNCKLMKHGEFTGQLVSRSWCRPINGMPWGTTLKYEWSGKGNCKMMINGEFTQQLVSRSFCAAIH